MVSLRPGLQMDVMVLQHQQSSSNGMFFHGLMDTHMVLLSDPAHDEEATAVLCMLMLLLIQAGPP